MMDASLLGLRRVLSTCSQAHVPVNILELWAIWLSLQCRTILLESHPIQAWTMPHKEFFLFWEHIFSFFSWILTGLLVSALSMVRFLPSLLTPPSLRLLYGGIPCSCSPLQHNPFPFEVPTKRLFLAAEGKLLVPFQEEDNTCCMI